MSSEHVEVLERLRGVLEHGKMGDKCLIAPDLVTAVIASLSAPQPEGAEVVDFWVCPDCSHHYMADGIVCDCHGRSSQKRMRHVRMAPVTAPQPSAEAQERPAKPAECADGCPDQQVCDHCQWPPGPDAEAQAVAWRVEHDDGGSHIMDAATVDNRFREALKQAGRRVTPLYAHPPPSAPVGLSSEDRAVLMRLKDALPDVGLNGWINGVRVIERILAQQPAAVDEEAVDWHVAEGQCIASVQIARDGTPIVICYGRDHPTGRYVLAAQQGGGTDE